MKEKSMKIVVLIALISFICNTNVFGMTDTEEDPVVRFHGCDDEATERQKAETKETVRKTKETKELVFTEEEVAQNEIKDVIKMTVSVRGNDETSVVRAAYSLPKVQKHELKPLLQMALFIRDGYVFSDADTVINFDSFNMYEIGSLRGKPVPAFACDAQYVATGYLFLRADYENIGNRWLEVLQDQKLSKYTNLVKELTEQVKQQRAQAQRIKTINNETLVEEDDNAEFRQEIEDARRRLAGLDPRDGLDFVEPEYIPDEPE